MAITSTESFLALLEKSQLLGEKDLAKVKAASGKYADAKALAKALIAAKGLTRWQAGQLLAGRSSFTLGKYRLVDLLGRGGMGSVFAAEHKKLGRRVALKIISKQTGRDPEQLERFLNEARRIAALDHPNIVRAFDVDHEGERYFLVLERVEGRDLQQVVEAEGPLDVERAVRFISQAAAGLAHAHERKMIHCDIKPANLIVGKDDAVKILDMGMARLVEKDGSSSDSNESVVGTIDYISPEQALESEDLDHRADIYSLGCTLYFLLTGRPPFGEGTLPQRIMKHQTQAPPPIADTRSGVPEEVVEVCLKMMEKKPEDRYQSAEEIVQALEECLGGGAPVAVVGDAPDDAGGPAAVELFGNEDAEDNLVEKADGEVSISVSDSDSFAVRKAKGSSRGRKPAAAAVAVVDDDEPVLIEPAGFFDDPRKKWGVIIGAGLLLLAGAGGGMAWMLGGDKAASSEPADEQVASAEPAPSVPAAAVEDGGLDLGDGLDLDSMFGGRDKPAAEKKPAPAEPEPSEEPAKAETKSDKPVAEEPSAMDGDAPAEPKKEEPKKEEAKKPEPKKEPAKKEEPKKEEAKKPEPKKEPPKKEPPKKPAAAKPFNGFPKATDLPILVEKDPVGEASRAPVTLGAVRGPATTKWQLLLVGGDKVMKGGRKFVVAQTEMDAAKASWAVELEGGSDGGKEKVARIWRQGENLRFQWDDKASAGTANYFRNCFLLIRASGESQHLGLTKPVKAEPVTLDLLRGQGNTNVAIKYAPDSDLIRFKFSVSGIKKVRFDPAEPVEPGTQTSMIFVYTDRYQNDNDAITYQIRPKARKTSLALDVRLVEPPAQSFKALVGNSNEQQIGVAIDQLGNKSTDIKRKMANQKGEEVQKSSRELDQLAMQIWVLEFFNEAHKKAALEYEVIADVGGQELVLVSTK